jgi:hypothetical protein
MRKERKREGLQQLQNKIALVQMRGERERESSTTGKLKNKHV